MIFVEGYDRNTGKTWVLDERPQSMEEAQIIASNMNNMEMRKTDGIVSVSYTAQEIKEDVL